MNETATETPKPATAKTNETTTETPENTFGTWSSAGKDDPDSAS
jgi:hypothetical protein